MIISDIILVMVVGRDSIPVKMPDFQSRELGFKSHCGRFGQLLQRSLMLPREVEISLE